MVDEVVYLQNPSNIRLQSPGGWAYINGGIRGIIVYRLTNEKFIAYERCCPHLSPNDCTFLDVEDDIKVVCRCDDKEFLLVTGEPLNGASHGLKRYNTYYDKSLEVVYIRN
jgi:nitrite reductase/ring-hydroxylating ferredoxin subunit